MSVPPVKTFAKNAEMDTIWVAITSEGVCWLLKPRNGGIQANTNGLQKICNSEAFASQYYITTGKW